MHERLVEFTKYAQELENQIMLKNREIERL
jgi:hypothetical protein